MAQSIWTGSISFGLVNIPVTLRSAESRDEIDFSLLDKRDFSPIGYRKYNKQTEKDVPSGDIVRGFEYEEGKYVIVTDDDLKRANVERTQTVEILSFVDEREIEPMYFERPYYLEPTTKSEKSYALLREALVRTKKVGVATVVIRTRQYMAAVLTRSSVLILDLLRYAHELVDASEVTVPKGSLQSRGISDKELKMAERLVEEMSEPWNPAQYSDEYHEELLAFIRRKAETGDAEPVGVPAAKKKGKILDLMGLLKDSLEQTGRGKRVARVSRAGSRAARRTRPRMKKARMKKARKKKAVRARTA